MGPKHGHLNGRNVNSKEAEQSASLEPCVPQRGTNFGSYRLLPYTCPPKKRIDLSNRCGTSRSTLSDEKYFSVESVARDKFTPAPARDSVINDNEFKTLLGQCRVEMRVIEGCDRVLEITTPLPAKPQSIGEAKRVLKDLRYVAWLLEGLRKDFLDGEAYLREYRAESLAYEQTKVRVAQAA